MGRAKTRYVKAHYKEVKVRRDFYEELRKLASEKGLSVPALIEEMFKSYTAPSMPADCIARRVKKGDKPSNVYFVECKDGAKAIVPREALADLSERFKLRIEVVD